MEIIKKIIASPRKCVLAITGGGLGALGHLTSAGGSSAFLLSSYVPYHPQEQENFLGFKPKSFCSIESSQNLAMKCFQIGNKIEKDAVGIGVSASLALAEGQTEREGREHKVFLTIQTADFVETWKLVLIEKRTRQQEEEIVSNLIINAILVACDVSEWINLGLTSEFIDSSKAEIPQIAEVYREKTYAHLKASNFGGIFSGSFNPIHEGHRKIREIAENILGVEVAYEITTFNADKPPINQLEIKNRIKNFSDDEPVIVSGLGTFAEKSKMFPNKYFVIGIDTAKRIMSPKFYNNDIDVFIKNKTKFLVFGRSNNGVFETIDDSFPKEFRDLCLVVSEEVFRMDISSTEIRK